MRALTFALVVISSASLAFAALGQPCVSGGNECSDVLYSECLLDLSTPDPVDRTCQCIPRYISDGTASCRTALNYECGVTAGEVKVSCNAIPYALCAPDATGKKMCQCVEGYTADPVSNLHCLAADLRDRCIENEQCIGLDANAKCSADTQSCVCPDGFVHSDDNKKCVEEKEAENLCSDDAQCPENSQCTGLLPATCECNRNFISIDRTCVPVANVVGDACVESEQCEKLNRNGAISKATCVTGRCMCPDQYVASLDRIFCLPMVSITNPNCIQDQQCPDGFYCKYPKCDPIPATP